jgi:hypothetical protein
MTNDCATWRCQKCLVSGHDVHLVTDVIRGYVSNKADRFLYRFVSRWVVGNNDIIMCTLDGAPSCESGNEERSWIQSPTPGNG